VRRTGLTSGLCFSGSIVWELIRRIYCLLAKRTSWWVSSGIQRTQTPTGRLLSKSVIDCVSTPLVKGFSDFASGIGMDGFTGLEATWANSKRASSSSEEKKRWNVFGDILAAWQKVAKVILPSGFSRRSCQKISPNWAFDRWFFLGGPLFVIPLSPPRAPNRFFVFRFLSSFYWCFSTCLEFFFVERFLREYLFFNGIIDAFYAIASDDGLLSGISSKKTIFLKNSQ
jgi:hypothetical protein